MDRSSTCCLGISRSQLGLVAQSVAGPTADPEVTSLVRYHTFVKINHEIISTVIFLPPLIQGGLLLVSSGSTST